MKVLVYWLLVLPDNPALLYWLISSLSPLIGQLLSERIIQICVPSAFSSPSPCYHEQCGEPAGQWDGGRGEKSHLNEEMFRQCSVTRLSGEPVGTQRQDLS